MESNILAGRIYHLCFYCTSLNYLMANDRGASTLYHTLILSKKGWGPITHHVCLHMRLPKMITIGVFGFCCLLLVSIFLGMYIGPANVFGYILYGAGWLIAGHGIHYSWILRLTQVMVMLSSLHCGFIACFGRDTYPL